MTIELTCPSCKAKTLAGESCEHCGYPLDEMMPLSITERAVLWIIGIVCFAIPVTCAIVFAKMLFKWIVKV